jgi:hypothetical protein
MTNFIIKNHKEDMNNAVSEFESAIDAQYFYMKKDSNWITYNDVFLADEITEDVKALLDLSNYEASMLENEVVILFSRPIFLSKLICQGGMFGDYKSKAIRLISATISQKKFVSNFTAVDYGTEFKINDTVRGIIFPTRTQFFKAKALDFYNFFSNEDKINTVVKAHLNLSEKANILKHELDNEINENTNFINKELSDYEIIKKDIEIAFTERERLENSSIENKEILLRIQNDIKQENIKLNALVSEKDKEIRITNHLKKETEESRHKLEKQSTEYASMATKTQQKNDEIQKLERQIIDMKKDINLTTLDMKGYSVESDKQLKVYFGFSLSALVFLAFVFFQIYANAESFVNFIDTASPKVNAWYILISRLPLITATTLVIGTISALLFYLVNHIVSVNADNMNMLKASILAEQITGTLPTTGMSDDDIRDYKRNTKIELVMNVFISKKVKIDNSSQFEQIIKTLKNIKPDK